METLLGIIAGVGLSAACGFRVFVPLLVMNLAVLSGGLHLSSGFEWIGSYYATVAFTTATIVEVFAYYIPWLDHVLDMIASPLAILAGMIATAAVITDLSPFWKWTLSIIAGGGIAALVQGATVTLRAKSSALTAGSGNFVVSTAEALGSTATALLAILIPLVCLILIIVFLIFVVRKVGRLFFRKKVNTL
jgi:hypothetical protein